MPSPLRIAIVLSHPIQYYSPWFRWMTAHGWTLRVFYLWDFGVARRKDPEFGREIQWDVDLLSGYDHEFVPNRARQPGTHHFRGLDNPGLPERLARWKPDAILLFGYKYITQLRLIFSHRQPLVFRGDSHLLDENKSSWLKRFILGRIYSQFAAVSYVGTANRAYFRAFGVPDHKLFHVPHCVDDSLFVVDDKLQKAAIQLRNELGIGARRVVLFAGKLIPKKQPRELLEAFLAVNAPDSALIFVGEGSEHESIRELAALHPEKMVRVLPFANQSEMPARYLLADIFALPSRGPGETWGLAVNEAMLLGIPCLVSNRVGCQQDLVSDGLTGWVFDSKSPAELKTTLARALDASRRDAAAFKERVLKRIKNYTYAQATAGLAKAVDHAIGRSHDRL